MTDKLSLGLLTQFLSYAMGNWLYSTQRVVNGFCSRCTRWATEVWELPVTSCLGDGQ